MKRVLKGIINAVLYAFFVILKSTHSTNIFAELDHRLTEYCTDQQDMCQHTGSFVHVVCEYYGKTGSSCSRFREVHLDESIVNDILHRINTMRIQVAKGEAMGKGKRKLPKAYGMKKVFWDSELAAFAQIMIYQCLAKPKYTCAATKYFSNPIMVYAIANKTNSATAIIDNIFSSWEAAARVTRDEIFRSPDFKEKESKFYIKMVVGNVSHVGCAIGVYDHEVRPFAVESFENIQFSGHMICYISHYSRAGTPVYNTTAPIKGTGWTRCGCPPMYRETKDCLCVPSPRADLTKQQTTTSSTKHMSLPTTSIYEQHINYEKYINDMRQIYDAMEKQKEVSKMQLMHWRSENKLESTTSSLIYGTGFGTPVPTCNGGTNCEPKIVMLPIFTIQNAPESVGRKMGAGYYRRSGSFNSVQIANPIDDLSFSSEKNDELSINISQRPKLQQTVKKIRNQEAVHSFSYEQNVEPDHQIIEHSRRVVPFEPILESTHLVETTTKQSHEERDRNENAKSRVNHLLDLLEEKGKKAQLTSREIIEFDAKMRRIYKNVLGKRENFQFKKVTGH